MTDEIKQLFKEILTEIAAAKEFTSKTDINTIFLSAEKIISTLAYLIGPIAEMEQSYRQLALPTQEESVAAAENRAKASNEYKDWKKATATYDLAHEQVMLLKKFREDLQKEYQRT